jgi:hypothetical protein
MLQPMFAKRRQKKVYPPGTFIPTPARICAIIQLCLVFTVILWNAAQPFAGDLFNQKSRALLYQDVMGISLGSELSPERQERLQRNSERFEKLSFNQQQGLIKEYEAVQKEIQRPFLSKLKRAFHYLFYEIPPFEQAWIVLSLLIPIMLLKKVEGAHAAIWLLPLVTLCYAVDNRLNSSPPIQSAEAALFPSESLLVADYLKEPLSENVFEQPEQLMQAWKLYLVKEWTKDTLNKQAEDGEFAFNLARIKARHIDQSKQSKIHGFPKEPLGILALYFFWNLFFAYTVFKTRS